MSLLNLDHIVFACGNLEKGAAWFEQTLGVPLSPGGKHLGFGTHNRLLQLAGGAYLELIAPDPSQETPRRPRPFNLDRFAPAQPSLVHFVANTVNIDSALAKLFYQPGVATTMKRDTLQWKISVSADARLKEGGVLPTVIEWPAGVHPSKNLAHQGVILVSMCIAAPKHLKTSLSEVFSDPRLVYLDSAKPWFGVELQTPRGRMFFNSASAL